MKVSDLNSINEIDRSIQQLLNQLSTLYEEREKLFKNPKKATRTRKSSTNLNNIDFNKFDLTIRD